MNKLMPFLDKGEAKKIDPPIADYQQSNKFSHSQYTGHLRNHYIHRVRELYHINRSLIQIARVYAENATGTAIDINFITLQMTLEKKGIDKEVIEYIKEKWEQDSLDLVSGLTQSIFDFQKIIFEELCLTGEIFIVFTRDDNNKLLLQPIKSEFIDPTINGKTKNEHTVINGIEYDKNNKVIAYWYRDGDYHDISKAIRLETSYTYRISLQSLQNSRGTPAFVNIDYLRAIWFGRYNLAVKGFKALSINGVLKTIMKDIIMDKKNVSGITFGGMQLQGINEDESGVSDTKKREIVSVGQPSIFSGDTHQFLVLRPNEDFDNFPASTIDASSLEAKKWETNTLAAEFGIAAFQLTGEFSGMSYSASMNARQISYLYHQAHTTPKCVNFMNEVFKYWVLQYEDDPIFKKLINDDRTVIRSKWKVPKLINPDPHKEAKAKEVLVNTGLLSPTVELSEHGQDPEIYLETWVKDKRKMLEARIEK
ncbi:MAG: phage portal protein [Brevinema sp.]